MVFDVDMKLNENDFFFLSNFGVFTTNPMWHVIIGYNLGNFSLLL